MSNELLPCPFCLTDKFLHMTDAFGKSRWMHTAHVSCMLRCFVVDDVTLWNTRTPAPVTEGAQREAVERDCKYCKGTGQVPIDDGYAGDAGCTNSFSPPEPPTLEVCEECFGSGSSTHPAPPPPDRVQPERVEAGEFVLLPRDPTGRMWAAFDDVCDVTLNQFRSGYKAMLAAAPATPTDAIERVEDAYECKCGWRGNVPDNGAILECPSCHSDWNIRPTPPTDASGGVTDARVEAALDEGFNGCITVDELLSSFPITIDEKERLVRAIIEAADRARKQGYRQVTMEDVRKMRMFRRSLPLSSSDHQWFAALQYIGAVIPEHAPGG